MARKQDKQNHERMVISVCHVATPDAEGRLRRAIDILLQAATRVASQSEENQNSRLARHQCKRKKPTTEGIQNNSQNYKQ